MVLAERNPENVRNGKRSRGPSPNGHASEDSSIEEESDERIRVGRDYQAQIPDLIAVQDRTTELASLQDRALLVWSPTGTISDSKLDDFVSLAKERYGYNGEQALGMFFWHKHDLERAILDLSNFTPFPDEWSIEDKVLFEQAFQFHGKSFHRIRQMLPDKSIASLVKYYYSWKKTRTRISLMDRLARKMANGEDDSDAGSDVGSNSDSDSEEKKWPIHRGIRRRSGSPTRTTQVEETGSMKKDGEAGGKGSCSNCSVACSQTHNTPKGVMCSTCYAHWTRTGSVRPTMGPAKPRDRQFHLLRHKRKPPRGMFVNHDDLTAMASGPKGLGEQILRTMDMEIVSLKRQVQSNKQAISTMRSRTTEGIDEYRPTDSTNRINARWTNEEMLLAVQGMRKYGKDFQAISEMIGTKSEAHLRNFFTNHRRRFNLDAVLKEFESENGPIEDSECKDEKMDVDEAVPASPTRNSSPISIQAGINNVKTMHKTAVSVAK